MPLPAGAPAVSSTFHELEKRHQQGARRAPQVGALEMRGFEKSKVVAIVKEVHRVGRRFGIEVKVVRRKPSAPHQQRAGVEARQALESHLRIVEARDGHAGGPFGIGVAQGEKVGLRVVLRKGVEYARS